MSHLGIVVAVIEADADELADIADARADTRQILDDRQIVQFGGGDFRQAIGRQ